MTNKTVTMPLELAEKLAALENIKEDEPNSSGADFCPVCYGRGNWNWKAGSIVSIDSIEHDNGCALVELRALLAAPACREIDGVNCPNPECMALIPHGTSCKFCAPTVERQEPVAWRFRVSDTSDWFTTTRKDVAEMFRKSPDGSHSEPLYTSPPAPVAVAMPELTDEQRDIEVTEMAEFMNHLSGGLRHFAGYLIDAGWRKPTECLDKVKELNK